MRSAILPGVLLLVLSLGLSSGCVRRSQNFYFGHYSDAERHYTKGEYEKAIEKYQAYRDENPEGNLAVIAQYYMAKSYQALGKTDEARTAYEQIKKEHPDLVWANFSETQLKELAGSTNTSEEKK